MEEDKNKRNKRNRKKKNKQTANQIESASLDARKSASDPQNHVVLGREEYNNGQVSRATDELTDFGGRVDADKSENLANCSEGASFLEQIKELQAEKDAQIQKQDFLEEKIKQLLKEKNENSQKASSQKDQILQLQDEKYASMKNEASLKEKLMQLEEEKDALIQKEDSLEQKNQQLLQDVGVHLQKEASLETQILQLQAEKDSWAQKQAAFEEKIKQMMKEAANLNSKEVSLQEKIEQLERERNSWILKENSTKESIGNLTNDNAQLRAQVLELEQVVEALLEEKKELREIISSLKLQIMNLERAAGLPHSSMESRATSEEDMKYQIDAAQALVEKLLAENSQLVEKVNELYAELDQRGITRAKHLSTPGSAQGSVSALSTEASNLMPTLADETDDRQRIVQAADSMSVASKMAPISGSGQSLEEVMVEDKRNGEHVYVNDGHGVLKGTSEIGKDEEIVQVSLVDETEVKEINLETAPNDENTDVPLTDAPLIGAPFRLISFVARYVSGVDLVNKSG